MTDTIVVLVTASSEEESLLIARTLVKERLAACVNITSGIRSIYRWKGEVCEDDEHLLIIKTQQRCFLELNARVEALHSYECPEVIALPVEQGRQAYLNWVAEQTDVHFGGD